MSRVENGTNNWGGRGRQSACCGQCFTRACPGYWVWGTGTVGEVSAGFLVMRMGLLQGTITKEGVALSGLLLESANNRAEGRDVTDGMLHDPGVSGAVHGDEIGLTLSCPKRRSVSSQWRLLERKRFKQFHLFRVSHRPEGWVTLKSAATVMFDTTNVLNKSQRHGFHDGFRPFPSTSLKKPLDAVGYTRSPGKFPALKAPSRDFGTC